MNKTYFFVSDLHFGLLSKEKENRREELFIEFLKYVKENGGYNSFDINMRTKLWDVETARQSIEEAFKVSDVVFASMDDVKTLYGVMDPVKAAHHLLGLGSETVVIKHGGEGCYVSTNEKSFTMPGYKVDVIDTTGSGDAFDGAWIKGITMEWELEKIASFSNAVGALTATGLGAVAPIPYYNEAVGLIKQQGGVW